MARPWLVENHFSPIRLTVSLRVPLDSNFIANKGSGETKSIGAKVYQVSRLNPINNLAHLRKCFFNVLKYHANGLIEWLSLIRPDIKGLSNLFTGKTWLKGDLWLFKSPNLSGLAYPYLASLD